MHMHYIQENTQTVTVKTNMTVVVIWLKAYMEEVEKVASRNGNIWYDLDLR